MATLPVEWATRLASQVTAESLVLGSSLVAGPLTRSPADQVAVQALTETPVVETPKRVMHVTMRAAVRWTAYTSGLALARDIAVVSHQVLAVTLTDWHIIRALTTAGAQYIGRGRDGGTYHFFTVTTTITAFDTTAP